MEALAVDAQLLRAVLTPDLTLTVGRVLSVRVADLMPGGRGTLSLAGVLLEAELPQDVKAGQELRLIVREVTPSRIVLGIQDRGAVQAQLNAPTAVPLPGGGSVHVTERDSGGQAGTGSGSGTHTLALTYDAPSLGAVEMQFALDPSSLRLALTVAAGPAFELAEGSADQLSAALSSAVGRAISVTVKPRREPVEVYA